jgi:hypothetical protein
LSDPATSDSHSPSDPKRGYRLAFFVYQNITGLLGALSIAAFLGHFIEFDWRGMLAQLFGVWDSSVRPTVKLLFDATIIAACAKLFKWHIAIPLMLRDYISAGVVLTLSGVRAERRPLSHIIPTLASLKADVLEWLQLTGNVARSAYLAVLYTAIFVGASLEIVLDLTRILWAAILAILARLVCAAKAEPYIYYTLFLDEAELLNRSSSHLFKRRTALAGILGAVIRLLQLLAWTGVRFSLALFFVVLFVLTIMLVLILWPFVMFGNLLLLAPIGDRLFLGMERFIFRRITHQPWDEAERSKQIWQGRASRRWTALGTPLPLLYLLLAVVINHLIRGSSG